MLEEISRLKIKAGVYIKFEGIFFAPPPFLIYIFYPNEIYYIEGVRAAGEKCQTENIHPWIKVALNFF